VQAGGLLRCISTALQRENVWAMLRRLPVFSSTLASTNPAVRACGLLRPPWQQAVSALSRGSVGLLRVLVAPSFLIFGDSQCLILCVAAFLVCACTLCPCRRPLVWRLAGLRLLLLSFVLLAVAFVALAAGVCAGSLSSFWCWVAPAGSSVLETRALSLSRDASCVFAGYLKAVWRDVSFATIWP